MRVKYHLSLHAVKLNWEQWNYKTELNKTVELYFFSSFKEQGFIVQFMFLLC